MQKTSAKAIFGLIGWLGLSFLVAAIGASFSSEVGWYRELVKPSWNPPAWVFGPVWTVLYIAMAVAAWRIWVRGGFYEHCSTLSVYVLQLLLNALWSPVFFGMHLILAALVVMAALWVTLLSCLILFFRKDKVSGYLMVPYLLWVTFAFALNFSIFLLNGA